MTVLSFLNESFLNVLLLQDSRPTLISAIEDCVFTFLWLTAAACPLNSTQHDECRVTNPATGPIYKHLQRALISFVFKHERLLICSPAGHLFDLSPLTKEGGYTVYDQNKDRKMFRMNICGSMDNIECGSGTGTYVPPSTHFRC